MDPLVKHIAQGILSEVKQESNVKAINSSVV